MSVTTRPAPEQAVLLVGFEQGSPAAAVASPARQAVLAAAVETCGRLGFSRLILIAAGDASSVAEIAATAERRFAGRLAIETMPAAPADCAEALQSAASRLDEWFLLLDGAGYFDANWLDLVLARTDDVDVIESLRDAEGGLAETGVYLVRSSVVGRIAGAPWRDALQQLRADGRIAVRVQAGTFISVAAAGSNPTLLQALGRPRRAVFFDRDGTLNFDAGYTHRPDELEFLPGAIAAVKRVNDLGYFAFLVTNQAGIAKGHFKEADMHAFNAHLQRSLRAHGAHLDDIRFCPDHPEGTVEPYVRSSEFRKPGPGMMLDLMQAWPVVKDGSLVVGDRRSDVDAAIAAGLHGALYTGGDLDAFLAQQLAALSRGD